MEQLPADLYWKSLKDPLTGKPFKAVFVKAKAVSVRERDPDLRPHYKTINPMTYGVIVAPSGFAAEEPVYLRSFAFLFKEKEELAQMLLTRESKPEFNYVRDNLLACKSYELALQCAVFTKTPLHEIAGMSLRAAWLYLSLFENDGPAAAEIRAAELKRKALAAYLVSFEKEDTSALKMGSGGVAFMIAELLRQKGDLDESIKWFSKLVVNKSLRGELKRNMQLQMEICREQRKIMKATGKIVEVEPERVQERAIFAIYRDQITWLENAVADSKLTDNDVIKGLLDGLKASGLDLTEIENTEALTKLVTKKLKKKRKPDGA